MAADDSDGLAVGLKGFFVRYLTYGCQNPPRRFSFDELGLADDMIFLHVAVRHQRVVCGVRSTSIDLDWRDHRAEVGTGGIASSEARQKGGDNLAPVRPEAC